MDVVGYGGCDGQQRVADPVDSPPAVCEPLGREPQNDAGLLTVRSDEHTLEPRDRLLTR